MKIKADSLWEYNGRIYRVMFNLDPMTIIEYNGEWYPTVKYRDQEYIGITYYKSSKEFLEKFVSYSET